MKYALVLFLLLCLLPSAHAASPKLSAALVKAVDDGNLAQIRKIIAQGADINARNDIGLTVLDQAAQNGAYDTVKLLLDLGANVNSARNYGGPLSMAARSDYSKSPVSVCRLLLARGANPNGRDNNTTPIIALLSSVAGYLTIPDIFFPYESTETKQDRRKNRMGNTLSVLRLLLQNGGDVNRKTYDGKTAMSWAEEIKNTELITLLQDAGARE